MVDPPSTGGPDQTVQSMYQAMGYMSTETQTESAITPDMIEQQLLRLQRSSHFIHSRRYPGFLNYVVRKTMDGHAEELKERTIGIEVFGRAPEYDLNADPIVRVTAGEVRKRLAQYYYEPTHQHELRIELHPGSYIPEFRFSSIPKASPLALDPSVAFIEASGLDSLLDFEKSPLSHTKFFQKRQPLFFLILSIAVLAAVAFILHSYQTSSEFFFWRPVLDSNGPVLISVGSVQMPIDQALSSPPVALADSIAISDIQQVLFTHEKASSIQSSSQTTFSDLQKGPVILISGFDNPWTMRLTESLRFHFFRSAYAVYEIQDRADPNNPKWAVNTLTPIPNLAHDFGLIARFNDRTTDQVIVVAAGIKENGTIAAAEMISDPKYLAILHNAVHLTKQKQNFEAVIETQIINGNPGPPRIVAAYTW